MTDIDYCHNAFFYYLIHNDTGGFYFVQKNCNIGNGPDSFCPSPPVLFMFGM